MPLLAGRTQDSVFLHGLGLCGHEHIFQSVSCGIVGGSASSVSSASVAVVIIMMWAVFTSLAHLNSEPDLYCRFRCMVSECTLPKQALFDLCSSREVAWFLSRASPPCLKALLHEVQVQNKPKMRFCDVLRLHLGTHGEKLCRA